MSVSPSFLKAEETLEEVLDQHGLYRDNEGVIEWKRNAKNHPRNWSSSKKSYNVAVVCFFELWMTAISSSGTAAASSGRYEYSISRTVAYLTFTSLYLFGQAIGSILTGPISEALGRRSLYIVSIAIFCGSCVLVAAIPSIIGVCFGRFFSGFASAIPATVAFGSFDDMYDEHERIWIIYIYTFLGNCGLVLGPIYSAYISTYVGWRWVFYISTIVSGVGIIPSIFLSESRTGALLRSQVQKIERRTGTSGLKVPKEQKMTFQSFLQNAVFRPLQFLITEPIVLSCAVLMAVSFSLIYGLTEGLTVVYTEFGFSEDTTSSLSFLALLVGLVVDVIPRFYEHAKFQRFRSEGKPLRPETKVDSLAIAAPALAIGLWLFAWTVPPMVTNVHWIVSMIGLVFVGFATNDLSYLLFGYLTDAYGEYAASACGALSLSRTIMAGIFPLFSYYMYSGLGGNVSTSIFASVATVFCITPMVFLKYGAKIRRMSRFAQGDDSETGASDDRERGIEDITSSEGTRL